ncbi:MAG TPA: hypothetical protein VG328_01665 [Stellaceae bacterium]|jgi:hypothetical protein|nr:hypothetical protein [Stellaceae bacterium]
MKAHLFVPRVFHRDHLFELPRPADAASADPTSSVTGNDPNGGGTWTAPAGPSSVQGGSGGDTLIGNTGDTTFIRHEPE